MDKCLITSCSNKFFPSLLNLIGSIKANYPDHPKIHVYSLELFPIFKKELQGIENLEIIEMPHFCNFWRSCYTWKTYIFNQPLAKLNLYLDAGTQVLRPLDEIFTQIKERGYFTVSQGDVLSAIAPPEYERLIGLSDEFDKKIYLAAGIFGFSRDAINVRLALDQSHQAALAGLCLGWSKSEQDRNRGKDKSIFIRNCKSFRHDQTLLNIFLRKYLGDFHVNNFEKYGGWRSPHDHPGQLIWHLRRHHIKLRYAGDVFKEYKTAKKIILNLFFAVLKCKRVARNLFNSSLVHG
jgi:hypothetical protein